MQSMIKSAMCPSHWARIISNLKKSTHFHIVFSLIEAAPTFLMVCFLSRVIIYSSWLWNIGCNLKEGMQELWIFWSAKMRVLHNMWQLPGMIWKTQLKLWTCWFAWVFTVSNLHVDYLWLIPRLLQRLQLTTEQE